MTEEERAQVNEWAQSAVVQSMNDQQRHDAVADVLKGLAAGLGGTVRESVLADLAAHVLDEFDFERDLADRYPEGFTSAVAAYQAGFSDGVAEEHDFEHGFVTIIEMKP